jgi:DNA (cytosine-5)-methyltransferase 1
VTDDETWVDGQVNPTLSLFDQGDTRATTVAVGFNWQNGGGYGNANDGLGITVEGTGPLQRCNTPAVAFQQNQLGEVRCGNIAGTVNTNSNASGRNTPMVAHAAVAFSDTSATLKGGSGERGYPDPSDGNGHSMVGTAMTVRRLTARECERLQAFPDDYTLIPWRKKQAEDCPDGPRYKALGNSMAVNCMAWIGERIAALENNR